MSIKLTGTLAPAGLGGFPIVSDQDFLGGWRVTANTTTRNAIPALNRIIGMEVYSVADGYTYQLVGGITNSNWMIASSGSGGSETLAQTLALGNITGGNNIVITENDLILGAIDITIQGGISDDLTSGGSINILAGNASEPGDINLFAGSFGVEYGSQIILYPQATGAVFVGGDSDNEGGPIAITAGAGTNLGGDVTLTAGSSDTQGGNININGGASPTLGGNVNITAGSSSAADSAGNITLTSGTVNPSSPSAVSGDITLITGVAHEGVSGDIFLYSGEGASTGSIIISTNDSGSGAFEATAGNIELIAGGSFSGTDGSINLTVGTPDGSGVPGAINFQGGSSNSTFEAHMYNASTTNFILSGLSATVIEYGNVINTGTVELRQAPQNTVGDEFLSIHGINSTFGPGGSILLSSGSGSAGYSGGSINLFAADGGATLGDGGSITIQSGAGIAGGGVGGNISIIAGVDDLFSAGGVININGGNSGAGGTVGIVAGIGANGNGGNFTVTCGAAGIAGGGGAVTMNAGNSLGDGYVGGYISLTAGNADNTGSGNGDGGSINFTGGEAAISGDGNGGSIILTGGSASLSNVGIGGIINISAGEGGGVSGNGGGIALQSGNATASGTGGLFTLQTGNGFGTGHGGNLQIVAGPGGASAGTGGNISLQPGAAGAGGTTGSILLEDSGATTKLQINTSGIGAFGATPVARQTVTGSRGGNAALASLLTALANLGWITDSSS